ncbi:MAG TPA: hypothetical protein DIW52_26080, partial [Pseudomonas sp.]|nr:hypothetical protein [Pseudomonas sp.]
SLLAKRPFAAPHHTQAITMPPGQTIQPNPDQHHRIRAKVSTVPLPRRRGMGPIIIVRHHPRNVQKQAR